MIKTLLKKNYNLWVLLLLLLVILFYLSSITVPLELFQAEEECVDENNQIQKVKGAVAAKEEVFLIYNKYNYQEASKVCKVLFNGRLATKRDLDDALKKGANWCSWGWLEGQAVGYPVQKDYWVKTNAVNKGFCGPTAGLNIIESMDPLKKFYATCYGIKPDQGKKDKVVHAKIEKKVKHQESSSSLQQDIAQCKQAKAMQWAEKQRKKVRILQFNPTTWSRREAATASTTAKKTLPQKKGWFS
jgi:hypothetical protein